MLARLHDHPAKRLTELLPWNWKTHTSRRLPRSLSGQIFHPINVCPAAGRQVSGCRDEVLAAGEGRRPCYSRPMTARLSNLPSTRIEKLETFLIERWCLLRIHCEDGTVGTGEAGVHGWPRPTAAMIGEMKSYLVGRDPSTIEHHAQALQRHSHFMGALVGGAISAIDIALWDIKARRYGVPIYELMGGKTRDRVRCYMHAKGNTLDELVADAVARKRQGFTAIRFSPFAPDYHLRKSFEEWVSEAERRVGAVHEALQGDADICIELHRQMNPAESIALGQRLRKFHPYFYEDPMLPDSPAMMGDVQARSGLPVATGERFSSIFQFQELLANNGCAYVRPDVCLCMGLTGSKKVAAMAEAHHVKVIPHNPLSPISTAACVQLDACIPNFALQEYTGESDPPKRDMVLQPLVLKDGYLEVPDAPGLGIELNDTALARLRLREVVTEPPIGRDGSVQDW